MMDTRVLITFLKAVELQNFNRVAEELNYAPSTVTTQIQRLEEELGLPLFDRIGKKTYLTYYGQKFLPIANKIMSLNQEIYTLSQDSNHVQGKIQIGTIESYLSNVFEKHISHFIAEFPKVQIVLHTANTDALLHMLKYGNIDLACAIGDKVLDPNFNCIWKRKNFFVFAASSKHPLTTGGPYSIQTILKEPLILSEEGGLYRKILTNLAFKQGIIYVPQISVDNTRTIKNLVENNMGITFLPYYALKESILQHKISVILTDFSINPIWFQIIIHKNKWISPVMKEMIRFIESVDCFSIA